MSIGTTAYDLKTALVVVDVQNDFADPTGALYVTGAENLIENINLEIDRAIAAGGHVVYTSDWHPVSTPHFAKDGGIWPDHCVGGSWGAEFHPSLRIEGPVVRKGVNGEDGYSGFTMQDPESGNTSPTGLEQILKDWGVEKMIVVGLATDYCVKATALDGLKAGFKVYLALDAVGAVNLNEGDGQRALKEIADAGGILVNCGRG
jgi:nicotinamidase/pyrazinamidase